MASTVRSVFPLDRVNEAVVAYHALLRDPEAVKEFAVYAESATVSSILGVEGDRLLHVELRDETISATAIRLDGLVSISTTGSSSLYAYEWVPDKWVFEFAHRSPIIVAVTTQNQSQVERVLARVPF